MGKTKEEIEYEETLEKLKRIFSEPKEERYQEPIRPLPSRPIRPIPNKPERLVEEEDYPEPRWNPKPLKGLDLKNFDEPKEKKNQKNPWIYVSVFAVIALVALGGYFTYTMSKQEPPQTNLNTSLSCPPVSCGANTCSPAACTCTPVIEGSNITCMPATINFFNGSA